MDHRKAINASLADWIKRKVETEYPQDIGLVCVYGSWLNGTMNARSDVDCYFVPETERSLEFAQTFLLEGVGYDIYPANWQRLEDIAALHSPMQPLLGDIQILYGTEAAMARLEKLRETMWANLADTAYRQRIAWERCELAANSLAEVAEVAENARLWETAGFVIAVLADAVAVSRGEYFHFGVKRQFEDLVEGFPGWVADGYRAVVEADSGAHAVAAAHSFLEAVCAAVGAPCAAPVAAGKTPVSGPVDAGILADIYQEICSTFIKIYISSQAGNAPLAFRSAASLQGELREMRAFGCPEMYLLEDYHFTRLEDLAKTTARVEEKLVSFIRENGGTIRAYDSFAAFEEDHPVIGK